VVSICRRLRCARRPAPSGLTGDRLAETGSTARLASWLRSASRNASRWPPARGRRCLTPRVSLRWTARWLLRETWSRCDPRCRPHL